MHHFLLGAVRSSLYLRWITLEPNHSYNIEDYFLRPPVDPFPQYIPLGLYAGGCGIGCKLHFHFPLEKIDLQSTSEG